MRTALGLEWVHICDVHSIATGVLVTVDHFFYADRYCLAAIVQTAKSAYISHVSKLNKISFESRLGKLQANEKEIKKSLKLQYKHIYTRLGMCVGVCVLSS